MNVQVHVEAGGGERRVHQVYENGTYVPASDSHFHRMSAEASSFVAKALSSADDEQSTNVNDPKWAEKAFTAVEGALFEMGRLIAVVEALRQDEPLLELKRSGRQAAQAVLSVPSSMIKDGPQMLMAKRRALVASADMLADRASTLRKWVAQDNDYCEALLFLRAKACGMRRTPAGIPLVDVGDANFSQVERVRTEDELPNAMANGERTSSDSNPNRQPAMPDAMDVSYADRKRPIHSRHLVHVNTPPDTFLCIGVTRLENDFKSIASPVVLEKEQSSKNMSLQSMLRRIRLARVSAFRRLTFDRLAREAAQMSDAVDFTTNSITLESGPYDVLRVERTMRKVAPSVDVGVDVAEPIVDNFRDIQDASVLQIVIVHAALVASVGAPSLQSPNTKVFDRVLAATCSRSVLRALEKVLDDVVSLLGVRVEWTRGSLRSEEARVCIWSSSADGDGPDRSLLSIEPLSSVNNGGDAWNNGHVKITPAYGVIIPAPDDPSARGRASVLLAQSSSSTGASSTIGLDDVPRSYVCPVYSGGEIVSVVTLLLCIRLLDVLELAARAGEAEVLDVDRQCFVIVVSAPQTGRTLRVKVWPRGSEPGQEVPGTTAWFNGQLVEDFPVVAPGRLAAWKKLLRRLVQKDPSPAKSEHNVAHTPNAQNASDENALPNNHTPRTSAAPGSSTGVDEMTAASRALASGMQSSLHADAQSAMVDVVGVTGMHGAQDHQGDAAANGHLNLNVNLNGFM